MKIARVTSILLAVLFFLTAAAQPQERSLPPGDTLNRAIGKLMRTAIRTGAKDTASGDSMFRVAISLAEKHGNHYLAGLAYYQMGEMYFRHRRHNKAFGAYFNAREQFNQTNAPVEMAYTLFSMGRQQYFRGNYKAAIDRLNFAMREAEKLRLPHLRSDVLEYLGILYHVIPATHAKDVSYLKKALHIKLAIKDEAGSLRIFEKLADVYRDHEHYKIALYYYNAAISFERRKKLTYDEALSRLDRVGIYISLNRLGDARRELESSGRFLGDGDININTRFLTQTANYYVAAGDTLNGSKAYDSALKAASEISALSFSASSTGTWPIATGAKKCSPRPTRQ